MSSKFDFKNPPWTRLLWSSSISKNGLLFIILSNSGNEKVVALGCTIEPLRCAIVLSPKCVSFFGLNPSNSELSFFLSSSSLRKALDLYCILSLGVKDFIGISKYSFSSPPLNPTCFCLW